jgi:hypothetical protein
MKHIHSELDQGRVLRHKDYLHAQWTFFGVYVWQISAHLVYVHTLRLCSGHAARNSPTTQVSGALLARHPLHCLNQSA